LELQKAKNKILSFESFEIDEGTIFPQENDPYCVSKRGKTKAALPALRERI